MPKILPPLPPTKTETKPEDEIKQQAITIIERANAVCIHSQETYNLAADLLTKEIKPMRSRWEAYWKGTDAVPGPVKLAYKTYKSLLDKFNEADGKLEVAENKIKAEIRRFDDEQRELQEKLQREAQEEAQRLEDAKRTETAVELQDQGISEEDIESFLEAPSTAIAAPVQPTYQRASGISRRDNWKAVVTDMKALCKAIGAGKVPVTYVLPNESVLNARAKADTTTLSIPGVVAKNEPIIAGRGR